MAKPADTATEDPVKAGLYTANDEKGLDDAGPDAEPNEFEADSDVEDETGDEPSAGGRAVSVGQLGKGAVLVLAVLVVTALTFVGFAQYRSLQDKEDADTARRDALSAARSEVLALTTISSTTSAADIKRLLAGATPSFREKFQQQAKEFSSALKQAGVTSTGRIASAGVESSRDSKAVVLVAATGTVKNNRNKKAEPRNYRLRVSLEKSGDRWLVAGMDFVA